MYFPLINASMLAHLHNSNFIALKIYIELWRMAMDSLAWYFIFLKIDILDQTTWVKKKIAKYHSGKMLICIRLRVYDVFIGARLLGFYRSTCLLSQIHWAAQPVSIFISTEVVYIFYDSGLTSLRNTDPLNKQKHISVWNSEIGKVLSNEQ